MTVRELTEALSLTPFHLAQPDRPVSGGYAGDLLSSENLNKYLEVCLNIVIGIIIFTSVFCIKNSFDISITEKTKQYGMLRSIGATKKQIKKNVF